MIDWLDIPIQSATREQRRALYRLGCARSLVARLDSVEADRLIKQLIEYRSKYPLKKGNNVARSLPDSD